MLGSTVVIAFGIFLYLPADVVPLAGEGAMKAISDKTGIMFSNVKIGFDISMVLVSLAACLIALRKPGAVGAGTVCCRRSCGNYSRKDSIIFPGQKGISC